MKSLLILCLLFGTIGSERVLASEAEVLIAPHALVLSPSELSDPAGAQTLALKLTNTSKEPWQFTRFYEGWSPVLLSADGEPEILGMARDATRKPQQKDYPILKPGETITEKRGCRLIHTDKGLVFILSDGTGGEFSKVLKPGIYQLCVSYRGMEDSGLLKFSTTGLVISKEQVWHGWSMSNWIEVTVKER